jgi:hypothetical protein
VCVRDHGGLEGWHDSPCKCREQQHVFWRAASYPSDPGPAVCGKILSLAFSFLTPTMDTSFRKRLRTDPETNIATWHAMRRLGLKTPAQGHRWMSIPCFSSANAPMTESLRRKLPVHQQHDDGQRRDGASCVDAQCLNGPRWALSWTEWAVLAKNDSPFTTTRPLRC